MARKDLVAHIRQYLGEFTEIELRESYQSQGVSTVEIDEAFAAAKKAPKLAAKSAPKLKKKSRAGLVFGVLSLFVLLAAGAGLFFLNKSSAPVVSAPKDPSPQISLPEEKKETNVWVWGKHEDKEKIGFQMLIPSHWKILSPPGSAPFRLVSPDVVENGATVTVSRFAIPGGIKNFISRYKVALEKDSKMKIHSINASRINGVESAVFIMTTIDKGFPIAGIITIIPGNGFAHMVDCEARQHSIERMNKNFNRMVESFRSIPLGKRIPKRLT